MYHDAQRTEHRDTGPLMLALGLGALLVVLRVLSIGMPGGGDAVGHFQHARYFWQHAPVALSQWGKPVFSLLASPCAQLGFWGMTLFDVLCAVATCILLMAMLRGRYKTPWRWAVPLLLFSTPVYVHTVMGGLTEPLFGLLSVAIVALLLQHRHGPAMALVSLLPFVRPEYAAFVPFAVAVVLWRKDFRSLPWLALGVVLYSLAAWILLGAPLAFFTDQTYLGIDAYGRGDLLWFVHELDAMYGFPLLVVLALAVLGLGGLLWRTAPDRPMLLLVTWLTLLPAIGIFALHSYAWYHGGMGSLGLLRVMATTVPLLVLFAVHVFASLWSTWSPTKRWPHITLGAALLLLGALAFPELLRREHLPVPDDEMQHLQRTVADHVIAHRQPGQRLLASDPTLLMLCGTDPWDTTASIRVYGHDGLVEAWGAHPGDLVIWDAHYMAHDGDVSLERISGNPLYRPLAVFTPRIPLTTLGGDDYTIRLYERAAAPWVLVDTLLFDLAEADNTKNVFLNGVESSGPEGVHFSPAEFPLTVVGWSLWNSTLDNKELAAHVELEMGPAADSTLFLTVELKPGDDDPVHMYRALHAGSLDLQIPVPIGNWTGPNKAYIWNTSGKPVFLRRFTLSLQGSKPATSGP